jgi:hypothetical protein
MNECILLHSIVLLFLKNIYYILFEWYYDYDFAFENDIFV